jgi:hypothetical protein
MKVKAPLSLILMSSTIQYVALLLITIWKVYVSWITILMAPRGLVLLLPTWVLSGQPRWMWAKVNWRQEYTYLPFRLQ